MSITSHAYFALQDWQDSDDTAIAQYNNLQAGYFHNTQWTEELRLVSPGTGTFHYTTGLFYSDVTYKRDFQRGQAFSIANWLASEGSESEAWYGQFDYEFLPNLSLIGGLRVNNEKIDMTFLDRTVAAGKTNYWAANKNDLSDTYKVGLQYQVSDDIMAFATRATGHKGPTYDLTTGFGQNRFLNGPVLPETSVDYEIGTKMQFFGHKLTVNPTLFTTDYSNFQAQGNQILPDGTTNFILSNVGTVRTQGLELDNSYRFSRDFSVSANMNYLNAYIVKFPKAQCYANQSAAQGCVGGFQDLSNRGLADAPKWKFTSSFDYSHPLGFMPWDGVVRGSYTYQSKVNYALTLDPYTVQSGYGIADISFGVRDQDDRYEIMGFVDNVGNQHYYSTIGDNSTNFGSKTVAIQGLVPRDFGRYAGVKLSAKF
jgi:iron complex outermembrane receptor protein